MRVLAFCFGSAGARNAQVDCDAVLVEPEVPSARESQYLQALCFRGFADGSDEALGAVMGRVDLGDVPVDVNADGFQATCVPAANRERSGSVSGVAWPRDPCRC